MIYWVTYDIATDRTRTKLAESLEVLGLLRIQKSVFAGKAPRKVFWKLVRDYEEKIEEEDKLFVLQLSEQQFRDMYALGLDEDPDRITGRISTLII